MKTINQHLIHATKAKEYVVFEINYFQAFEKNDEFWIFKRKYKKLVLKLVKKKTVANALENNLSFFSLP